MAQWLNDQFTQSMVTFGSALRHCISEPLCAKLNVRCSMPILIMGLAALAVFVVIGALLFAAGISERKQELETPEKPVPARKAA